METVHLDITKCLMVLSFGNKEPTVFIAKVTLNKLSQLSRCCANSMACRDEGCQASSSAPRHARRSTRGSNGLCSIVAKSVCGQHLFVVLWYACIAGCPEDKHWRARAAAGRGHGTIGIWPEQAVSNARGVLHVFVLLFSFQLAADHPVVHIPSCTYMQNDLSLHS